MLASYIIAVSRTVCTTGLCETYFNPTKAPQSQFNSGLIYPFHHFHLFNGNILYTSGTGIDHGNSFVFRRSFHRDQSNTLIFHCFLALLTIPYFSPFESSWGLTSTTIVIIIIFIYKFFGYERLILNLIT